MSAEAVSLLLVEDSDDDVVLAEEAFREAGLANPLLVVRDGHEALAFLREWGAKKDREPLLILLDINLPGMDGFEVLHELKIDPSLWHLPVVMLTTSDAQLDIVKAYSRGVCTYLQKPLTYEKLQEVAKYFDLSASLHLAASEAPETV